MINVIDIVVAALALFYLLKNSGGVLKTLKNIVIVLLILIVFGLVARLILDTAMVPGSAQKTLGESYFVRLSHGLIRLVYPAVETSAPKIDSYIKDKIISTPTAEVKAPKINIPKIAIPQKELEKLLLEEDTGSEKKK